MAQTTANLVATCLSNSNNMETENINTNDIEAPAEEVHDNPGTESSVSNRRLGASGRKQSLVGVVTDSVFNREMCFKTRF